MKSVTTTSDSKKPTGWPPGARSAARASMRMGVASTPRTARRRSRTSAWKRAGWPSSGGASMRRPERTRSAGRPVTRSTRLFPRNSSWTLPRGSTSTMSVEIAFAPRIVRLKRYSDPSGISGIFR